MQGQLLATLALVAALGAPADAWASAVPVRAEFRIDFLALDFSASGSGTALVNGSSGGADLTALGLPAGLLQTTGFEVAVTDPTANPIDGFQLTLANGPAAFAETGSGRLRGRMAVVGVAKVCLFGSCCGDAAAKVSVPLSPVGFGGVSRAKGSINVTVTGAPWTTGTVFHLSGSTLVPAHGFRHGPASAASSAASPSGVVQLVTPIFISTAGAGSDLAWTGALGTLTLHFAPEPGTAILLGLGVGWLAWLGRARGGRS
jgi:hypothetical protein